eukprot:Cvel_27772.t1-p1 / transcript=Cvel_27772.t1 / gene=Cvel_27772 / organism=Chromera_velia_CCMP2878 / gene_product=Ferredoxin-dependent glutamate synthase 1, putative / transcript_product=Ferredoxin-dependent glutamate synthase 1, putative / location=Cvel_scaffold3522:19-1844(-) / protein_length=238 / sequence_SO=supercontig / SO=protein_coding / is_pseudo=false
MCIRRYVCHNAEIDSLRENINWMDWREAVMHSEKFGARFSECFPIVEYDQSALDVSTTFLRPWLWAEAMTLLVPEAWRNAHAGVHGTLQEGGWVGFLQVRQCHTAMTAFTDGDFIGATLDRNGLRPCRFYVTKDNRIIGGSEAGCLHMEPENVARKWRLQPEKIIADHSTKLRTVASEAVSLPRMKAMGYTVKALDLLIRPCLSDGMEPLGSMGTTRPSRASPNSPDWSSTTSISSSR